MYQLVRAYCRRDSRRGRWEETDLSQVIVDQLRTEYSDVWLFITYPGLDEPKALRFAEVANWLTPETVALTVPAWLTSLGNRTLPFAETPPGFTAHYVRYAQAWHAGYTITPVARHGTPDQGGSVYDKTDLAISHPDLTGRYIGEHALFTVNGLFHLVDYDATQAYILDGNKTVRRANDNHIGVYSFAEIGKLQAVPITADMLSPMKPEAPLRQGVYATLPDSVDLTDKTVLLVLGGYLQVLGKGYTRVGDRTYRIELGQLMLLERYYDSYQTIDLSSLGLSEYEQAPTLLSVAELQSDAVIRAYLTLSQSFFVVVDSPSFFQELVPLEHTRLPGRYLDYDHHHIPVMGAYGRMLEYHAIAENDITVIAATNNLRHNYDFYRRNWRQSPAVNAGRYPANPAWHTHAYLRYMGVEK